MLVWNVLFMNSLSIKKSTELKVREDEELRFRKVKVKFREVGTREMKMT